MDGTTEAIGTTGNRILNTLCLTLLLLDSGGGLGLRNFAFISIVLTVAGSAWKPPAIDKKFIFFYLIFLASIVPGIVASILADVPIAKIIPWIMSFLLLPILYLYAKVSHLSGHDFSNAGKMFALAIIILFIGRLMAINWVLVANDYIMSHSEGFFGDKNFTSGDVLPNVYFQGTLGLVICGCMSLRYKRLGSYFLMLLALIMAPSRFGFITLSMWGIFVFFWKNPSRIVILPGIIALAAIVLAATPFGQEILAVKSGQSDAVKIRNNHILSVLNIFQHNPAVFIFGQGPGTEFYTTGFNQWVDNIELSQFEYLRKYGIVSFIAFHILYFLPLLGRSRNVIYIGGTLIVYYLASFSNPVLFSIFAMLFLSWAYITSFEKQDEPALLVT